jgi:hypothetical protein
LLEMPFPGRAASSVVMVLGARGLDPIAKNTYSLDNKTRRLEEHNCRATTGRRNMKTQDHRGNQQKQYLGQNRTESSYRRILQLQRHPSALAMTMDRGASANCPVREWICSFLSLESTGLPDPISISDLLAPRFCASKWLL